MARKSKKQRLHDLVTDSAQFLLANIRFTDVDHPVHTVVITSSIPNEGKTFVSVNLAKAMAGAGRTCLLMEGDLRKRSVAATIGVHPRHGIYSVVSGRHSLDQVIVPTAQERLFFLDAEPRIPDPPDFLGSHRYAAFLDDVSKRYDYVVIDTPPVGTFVDAAIIAAHVDATFLVIRQNFTRRNIVQQAVGQLKTAGAHLKGVIMNDCNTNDRSSSSYYDYYSYYSNNSGNGEVSAAGRSSFHSTHVSRTNDALPTKSEVGKTGEISHFQLSPQQHDQSEDLISHRQETGNINKKGSNDLSILMNPPSPDDVQQGPTQHARRS